MKLIAPRAGRFTWGCCLVGIVVSQVLTPVPSQAKPRKTSPAQVVQAFLHTSYDPYGRSEGSGLQDAIERYGSKSVIQSGDGCYRLAAERWVVRRTRVKGANATVAADIWIWRSTSCNGSVRYFPANRVRVSFDLVRERGAWKLRTYHPLLSRAQALEARDEPLYLVIAGSFRTSKAAERHMRRHYSALSANDSIASIQPAGDFANLSAGWFIVLPDDGQASSLGEARQVRERLAKSGVSAYVRRIH